MQPSLTRSVNLGQTVAQRIFDWSDTDGSGTVYPPYVPPVGPGLWAPTPPNFPQADGPYWGLNRPMVVRSIRRNLATCTTCLFY